MTDVNCQECLSGLLDWRERVVMGMLFGAYYGPLGPFVTVPLAIWKPDRLVEALVKQDRP